MHAALTPDGHGDSHSTRVILQLSVLRPAAPSLTSQHSLVLVRISSPLRIGLFVAFSVAAIVTAIVAAAIATVVATIGSTPGSPSRP